MSDDHIHQTRFCRDEEIFDHTAIVQHADLKSTGIGDDVFIHLIAVFGHTKGLGAELCHKARLLLHYFRSGQRSPNLVHNYDYSTVFQTCVRMLLDLSSKISRDFLDILPPSQALTRQLSQRESHWHDGQVCAARLGTTVAQKSGPCYPR